MAQSRQDAQRKSRAGESVAAKHKQLEAFAQSADSQLTTNHGVTIPDNHNSLKAGPRGPTLLEDFILQEKLSHFAQERIPERVVYARGCAAHGYFELVRPMVDFTRADFLQEVGSRTPVFVRFSNLTGARGSADTVRDARGFAVKFYTREGNFDLVGSSFPVAFVQDAMKYPDFIHALQGEAGNDIPQASSAHDTFWDFASLMPETTHALMWLMSDHALPRSLRMMAGFGVHTFRLVNARGAVHCARFLWRPRLGRHALLADEAVKIAGRDPDFLRRDLWESLEAGQFPEWELTLQLVPQERAASLGFDLFDPTKLLPEEVVQPLVVGRLVLNRNPDSFFAETEQVAFHPGHLVPGIDFSEDPLLQGRLSAYTQAQAWRLSGPKHHELPINRSLCPVHNFQRGGANRLQVNKGPVAYEPNSLATGAEFRVDGGQQGFQTEAVPLESPKLRRRSASFDDHFSQASFFWNSQGPTEKEHIVAAFLHELTQVTVQGVRQRVVDNLAHVDSRLARKLAEGLGLPPPDPKAAAGRAGFRDGRHKLPIEAAPSLSIEAAVPTGSPQLAGRRVAVLVASGVEVGAMRVIQQALQDAGASCSVLGERLGSVATASGQQLAVTQNFQFTPSVLFDAVLVPGGPSSVEALAASGDALHFVLEAYRHGKPLCLIGEAVTLLASLGVAADGAGVPGLVVGRNEPPARAQLAQDFLAAMARHRHWGRPGVASLAA
ncbi:MULTISPECIES: catalase [Ramlibacter]|uniref:Catalase n=1 Tax=Ramlibacter aquaticus TaxID=2780094 RepID=A0ABR9SDH3_9BURK|nr:MULTISPECIES: catalase [Ramlibacter]MBE7940408.1 catalase [Ramlibacter aquaticus]